MFKTILNMLVGALVTASISLAIAATGNAPIPGFQTPDGTWLLGVASGGNESYVSGVKAAGTTQATATQLPAAIALIEIDTVGASSGVNLPPALKGTEISVFNSTSTTLLYYPAVANNPVTAAQDTINGATSLSVSGTSGGTTSYFMCAKDGVWGAK